MIKIAIIRKLKPGKYRLYSKKKGPGGKRRNLGTFDSLSAAKEHEKDVAYFKHHADDGESDDTETQMLSDLSDIATFLEEAGFVDKSDQVYAIMKAVDHSLAEDYLIDGSNIPDAQKNVPVAYIGGDGTGGGYSMLNMQEGQKLDDQTIEELEKIHKKPPISKREPQKDEAVARSNGLQGNTSLDSSHSGFFQGLSDMYFYRGTGSIEDNM